MSGYRSETEAALARAEALEEENARLREQLAAQSEASVRLAPIEQPVKPEEGSNAVFFVIFLIPLLGIVALLWLAYIATAR